MDTRSNTFRPRVEALEDRLTPMRKSGGSAAVDVFVGVLAITPPAAGASPHVIQIHQQVAQITLPDGAVIPGHGLKTAEAHSPVVDWTPT